ncbi:hypothetical protein CTI14_36645 [Methylobacterium radiotolerans]|nr:hypothetical protein CTI14_36645 [Methylobacterium radiotolerans]
MPLAYAQEAERQAPRGVLLLPPLPDRSLAGRHRRPRRTGLQVGHVGVIVYNRAQSRLSADSLARLADRCPNLVGFKDGIGDIESMVRIRRKMGDRFSYLGGLPTAKSTPPPTARWACRSTRRPSSTSCPKMAMEFYNAIAAGDSDTTNRLLDDFFLPYLEIRNRKAGYAVSIVKAGAKLVGHDAGPVRAPLTDLTGEEMEMLAALIKKSAPSKPMLA